MIKKVISISSGQTKQIGKQLAKEILKARPKKIAIVLGLQGNLGSGKTTFLQGFAKGLGIKEKILSPTFVILKRFKITKIKNQKSNIKNTNQKLKFINFYHIDCYRIKNSKDLELLGFKEIILNPKNIIAVEWSERVKKFLPAKIIIIKFSQKNKNKRKIIIN